MATPRKEVDLAGMHYPHREAAADLLISKARKLADFVSLYFDDMSDKDSRKARQAVSFYDLALHLMKPYDGGYQTIIHWKCLVLIALEQYEEAASWYEELIRLVGTSEGPNYRCPTARAAAEKLAELKGMKNTPLPELKDGDAELLDEPGFCWWAAQFCNELADGKFKLAHGCLSGGFGKSMTLLELKRSWLSLVDDPEVDLNITLGRYELAAEGDAGDYVGWCYFVISGNEINEAIAVDVYQRPAANSYEIRAIDFGRP